MRIENGKSYIEFGTDMMNETELEITMLYVDPAERGQKKGHALLDSAVQYAKENEYSTVGLCAYPQEDDGITEDALIAYYEDYGFESDGDCSEIMSMEV